MDIDTLQSSAYGLICNVGNFSFLFVIKKFAQPVILNLFQDLHCRKVSAFKKVDAEINSA